MDEFIHWLELHQLGCPFREHFGVACPGCGFQRSFLLLLNGNIWGSMVRFPAMLPFLSTWIYLIAHLIFRFPNGARNLIVLYGITAALVIANFVTRVILFGPAFP